MSVFYADTGADAEVDADAIVNVDANTDCDGDAYTSTNVNGECAVHVPLLFWLPCM